MKIKILLFICLALNATMLLAQNDKNINRPNIIYFLADDLGYGEIGVQGQKIIKTPNIDALAEQGLRFTQHYTGAPVCAPARSVLLTGQHTGHTYVRGNDEMKEKGDVWNYIKASNDPNLEGQRPLPANTITIGKLLQKAGYKTGVFGKWGLGGPGSEGVPGKQGFDRFYGYNCQRQAHNLYPAHLWEDDHKDPLNNELISSHTGLDKDADPNDPAAYAKFEQKDYAPEKIHEKALEFIRDNDGQPFFLYYASPLPHLPLQIPSEYTAQYEGLIEEVGPYTGEKGYFPNQHPRAAYAAMISYLDAQLGELISLLKEKGIYENTLIIFTSDNGPSYTGGVDFEYFNSSQPFSNGYGRTKGFVYEGGIRVPMIASWAGKIKPGASTDHISAFYDVMPTLCELTGIDIPKETDGISFAPTLFEQKQKKHDFLYWEFPSYQGQQAVRMGKWKGIRKDIFKGNLTLELYDLEKDPQELHDIASQNPKIVAKIQNIMKKEHVTAENAKFHFKELGDGQ